ALREYINRELVESDHARPDQKRIDMACRPKARSDWETKADDETKPTVPGETELPAVCPGKAAQLDKELNDAFAHNPAPEEQASDQPRVENLGGGVCSVDALLNTPPSNEGEKQEVPPALNDREIEIAHALNELVSGRTNIVDKDEIEYLITTTGKDIVHLFPLLIADITTTEFCLSPDFSDEEVQ